MRRFLGSCVVLVACGGAGDEGSSGGGSEAGSEDGADTGACEAELGVRPAFTRSFDFLADASAVAVGADERIAVRGKTRADPIDFGGGALAGQDGDGFVLMLAADGSHLWSMRHRQQPPGSSPPAHDVLIDGQGRIVIEGDSDGGTDLGGGPIPAGGFIAVLEPDGDLAWTWSRPGGDHTEGAMDLAVDAAGNIYEYDGVLFKLDPDGNQIRFESEDYLDGAAGFPVRYSDIVVDAAGDVFFLRQKPTLVDAFEIARLDSADWTRIYSLEYPNRDIELESGAVDAAGNLVVAGRYSGVGIFGEVELPDVDPVSEDTFVVSFDPAGVARWALGVRGAAPGTAVAAGEQHIVVRGTGTPPFDFAVDPPLRTCLDSAVARPFALWLDHAGKPVAASIEVAPEGVMAAGPSASPAVATIVDSSFTVTSYPGPA